jgi:hypothetical protein
MPTPLASQIEDVLPRTTDAYYKLVLAVGPARTGKTAMLIELAELRQATPSPGGASSLSLTRPASFCS